MSAPFYAEIERNCQSLIGAILLHAYEDIPKARSLSQLLELEKWWLGKSPILLIDNSTIEKDLCRQIIKQAVTKIQNRKSELLNSFEQHLKQKKPTEKRSN